MKKLLFTLAALGVAVTSAQAQKQMGDEHNIEVSFNPLNFAGNPIDASVIKYRKFLDDDAALRVTLGISNNSNKFLVVPENSLGTTVNTDNRITHNDLFLTNNESGLAISLGYEKHFRGTDNLSPYVAFAAGYSTNSITLTRDHFSAISFTNNPEDEDFLNGTNWIAETRPENWDYWSYTNDITSNSINVDLLFGTDYYFNDAIYVGFEAGLRFTRTSGVTSSITASNAAAFNMYFDGGQGNDTSGDQNDFVVNTGPDDDPVWDNGQAVNYTINGEPWNSQQDYGLVEAIDALWSDWGDQQSSDFDEVNDDPRNAYFNGSNYFGMYSTGMLRLGFLFN